MAIKPVTDKPKVNSQKYFKLYKSSMLKYGDRQVGKRLMAFGKPKPKALTFVGKSSGVITKTTLKLMLMPVLLVQAAMPEIRGGTDPADTEPAGTDP